LFSSFIPQFQEKSKRNRRAENSRRFPGLRKRRWQNENHFEAMQNALSLQGPMPALVRQKVPIIQKLSANLQLSNGPMWASAPTFKQEHAVRIRRKTFAFCRCLLLDLSVSFAPVRHEKQAQSPSTMR